MENLIAPLRFISVNRPIMRRLFPAGLFPDGCGHVFYLYFFKKLKRISSFPLLFYVKKI